MLGRFMKYLMWTGFFLYSYHVYLVFKTEKPEEKAFDDRLLGWAFNTKYMYQDLKELLTQPPVKCLLGDRGPAPPGAMFPKTLVLNVNGTLVHSEYKVRSKDVNPALVWNWLRGAKAPRTFGLREPRGPILRNCTLWRLRARPHHGNC